MIKGSKAARAVTATLALLALAAVALALAAHGSDGVAQPQPARQAGKRYIPHYKHVVLAIFENHQQPEVIGTPQAPYLTGLSRHGANFTRSFAIEHPSQPNYLDLFSGSNQGVTGDLCPNSLTGTNLAAQLRAVGKSFVGYSEGLPLPGSSVCTSGRYARKHAPWTNFGNLNQRSVSKPLDSFPRKFGRLPQVSWVVPNLCNDMHDCSVATGDSWSRAHLKPYAEWAKRHDSLLIVTFDEDDYLGSNRIPTIFYGAHLKTGDYASHIDHFTVLRTIEKMFGLPGIGNAATRIPISSVFRRG